MAVAMVRHSVEGEGSGVAVRVEVALAGNDVAEVAVDLSRRGLVVDPFRGLALVEAVKVVVCGGAGNHVGHRCGGNVVVERRGDEVPVAAIATMTGDGRGEVLRSFDG